MTLNECIHFLKNRGYLITLDKKYHLTPKFQTDVQKAENQDIVPATLPVPTIKGEDWTLKFTAFISDAKVPARLEDSRGGEYASNKFNDKAMKIFKGAMERGLDYQLLVLSTSLYYKSSLRYKKTIGNYFIDGDWFTDYTNLKNAGETNQVKELIQTEIKQKNDGYSLG